MASETKVNVVMEGGASDSGERQQTPVAKRGRGRPRGSMKGIVAENTIFSYTILHIPGYAIPMYEYEYRDNYGIIPLKTVRGDYAPAQALSIKTMSSLTSGSSSRSARR